MFELEKRGMRVFIIGLFISGLYACTGNIQKAEERNDPGENISFTARIEEGLIALYQFKEGEGDSSLICLVLNHFFHSRLLKMRRKKSLGCREEVLGLTLGNTAQIKARCRVRSQAKVLLQKSIN